MANFKKKHTNLYNKIIDETDISHNGDNLIIFTIDDNLEFVNYLIDKSYFIIFINKIKFIFDKDNFTVKEVENILERDIFKIYKTKVAIRRIPFILLNSLVKKGYLYSDNGYNYKIKENIDFLNNILIKL